MGPMDDTRQAELDGVWIDGAPRHDTTIHLAPYNSEWPAWYAREAKRIRTALGDRVRVLEHAGSTSVPGLSAKPVIDIVLAVADSGDEDAYVPDMVEAGYRLVIREPEWYEHRLFKGPDTNINLHTFTEGSPEIRRMLAFRDRLRSHPEELAAYEAAKQELAGRTWAFVQDYADAKGVVVEGIIARALAGEDATTAAG
jgi:GrpB-like predicted nucleotidyltransferase (UPF0157 family)